MNTQSRAKNTSFFSSLSQGLWADFKNLFRQKLGALKEEAREMMEAGKPKLQQTTVAILLGIIGTVTSALGLVYLLTDVIGLPLWGSFLVVSALLLGTSGGVLWKNEVRKQREQEERHRKLEAETQATSLAIEQKLEIVEQAVKQKVSDVAETLSLKHHVDSRPLLILGGTVAAGVIVGINIKRKRGEVPLRTAGAVKRPTFFQSLASTFEGEAVTFRKVLVAGFLNALEHAAEEKMPSLTPYLKPVADSAKKKASLATRESGSGGDAQHINREPWNTKFG